jgi:hypothetical protein
VPFVAGAERYERGTSIITFVESSTMAAQRELIVEHVTANRFEGVRVSWGGVVGGVLVAFGLLLLLVALGTAVGSSAAVSEGDAMRTAIWSSLALLVALFCGGVASTRMSLVWDSGAAMLQGFLVWVLCIAVVLFAATNASGIDFGAASGLIAGSETMPAARAEPVGAALAAWGTFAALVLSLIAALVGASLGRRRAAARAAR